MQFQSELYVWALAVGIPILVALWGVTRRAITSRTWRSLMRAFLVSLLFAPTAFSPHGPLAVFPAVILIPMALLSAADGGLPLLLFALIPIAAVTAVAFPLLFIVDKKP